MISMSINKMLSLAICILFLSGFGAGFHTAEAQNIVPAQFIAKLYTEGLGRAPDQTGWTTYVSRFQQNGCNISQLQTLGEAIYTSSEFLGDYGSNQPRVLALFRGALNRDADQAGFDHYVSELNSGTSWTSVVQTIFNSTEFSNLVPTICSSTAPGYGFGNQPPPSPTPIGAGFTGSEASLQTELNAAASGSTVCIAQQAVIALNTPLIVPSGVTLTTCGSLTTYKYALMARLVRSLTSPKWQGPNVQLQSGAKLTSVWVDGQRNQLGYYKVAGGPLDNADIVTLGGSGILVANNKLSEPQGGTVFYSDGLRDGHACSSLTIQNNLLTAYTAIHGYQYNSDGLTMTCENATISNNAIVDISDIGIVLFTSPGVIQSSTISNNVIVSAGGSINAPISTDPTTGNTGGQLFDYSGTSFNTNTFWTGPYTTFDFAIEAGAREYHPAAQNSDGTGAKYVNNTTGTLSARVRAGIAVTGMLNVSITNDASHPLNVTPVTFPSGTPAANCPSGAVIVDALDGHASGTYPTPTFNGNLDGCI